MTELLAGLATLSLFLAWRVYSLTQQLHMAKTLLHGIVSGRVSITRKENGFDMEVKHDV